MILEDDDLSYVSRTFPIGKAVKYFPVSGQPGIEETTIRSRPWRTGSGAILIQVEGRSGGVSIDHLRMV